MQNLRKQWNETCEAAGLKPITTDTAARIMAIVYCFDDELMTHSPKFMADIEHIQRCYGIDGGKRPYAGFRLLFVSYVREIERNDNKPPQWAVTLMQEMYGIKI